jgi:crossover junction endodeoxyribonuclease RuvC
MDYIKVIVLGIDPGTATTGYGIVKDSPDGRLKKICYGVIRTDAKTPFPLRLKQIHDDITNLIEQYKPEVAVIEQLFFSKNVKTALSVAQSRGVIILTAVLANLDIAEYTPLQVKEAVATYGRAEKIQIQHMVKVLLGLDEIPKPDDAADALALAICHLHSYKMRKFNMSACK